MIGAAGEQNRRLRLDFPMTPDLAMDAQVRQLVRWAAEYVIEHLGAQNIRALVLGGSLSTGEGSAFMDAGGYVRLLSDLDVYVVSDESSWTSTAWESANALLRLENNQLNSALNSDRPPELLSPIDTIFMSPEQIQRFWSTSCIASLQLSRSARVLWGDEQILPQRRTASVEEITDEDLFKLLNNRMTEQVFYHVRYKAGLDTAECFAYHTCKAAVDAVLAICVAARQCPPRLCDRLRLFEEFCQDPDLGPEMAEWGGFWTRFKLKPDLSMVVERFGTHDVESAVGPAWDETASLLLRALSWSAKTRLGYEDQRIEVLALDLAEKLGWSSRQRPLLKTIVQHPRTGLQQLWHGRGLHKVDLFRQELMARNLAIPGAHRLRTLSKRGSPRSLTYASATLLLAARGEAANQQRKLLRMASQILPVAESRTCGGIDEWWPDLAQQTARLWNHLVMDGRR